MDRKSLKILNLSKSLKLPEYAHPGDAGLDLMACFDTKSDPTEGSYSEIKVYDTTNAVKTELVYKDRLFALLPKHRYLIPTGIKISLDEGCQAEVRPRSGNALKKGLTVLNTPGTVDESYRGEVGVILINMSSTPIYITHGEKIAQLVIMPYIVPDIYEVDSEESLGTTVRGGNGYGSSDK